MKKGYAMKKFFAGILLTMSVSFSVSAEPVFLYPFCSNWGTSGECTLNNTSGKTVSCNIHVNGYTRKGQSLNQFQYSILYPYQMTWIRVYPRDPQNDQISYLSANAFCNTLN